VSQYAYLSRFSQPQVVVNTYSGGTLVDPDAGVDAAFVRDDSVVIFDRPATRSELGEFYVQLSSVETSAPGKYEMQFRYVTDGIDQIYVSALEVGQSSPRYDALEPKFRGLIEETWGMFSSNFDSPAGGLYLQTLYQSGFNREKLAELLSFALGRLNVESQPVTSYSLDGTNGPVFPDDWIGVLGQALGVEVIKHIIRAYTEQPDMRNVTVAYLDRRDYLERWRQSLIIEQAELDKSMETFRIRHMGLGRASVLVAGGAYGRWHAQKMISTAARPKMFVRCV